uniref:Putative secreted protein n=1 Tax=Anopheles triannulatus TaxID=58253 RepID=A0A2M4B3C1_9DIPT
MCVQWPLEPLLFVVVGTFCWAPSSSFSNTHPPWPSNCRIWVWNFHNVGRWVMVRSVMSMDLAVSYMQLSTSIDTALVHSSSKAYFGLW